ncbi:unnamed protein product [Periconia digitata]|uniref:Uncharacterized protein n=1 Tax=Periconia digitata TaxID=1303443 RepID=A0A9W4U7S1_9PLEO|nr:unnamed protein product [Periconia digitata]
MRLKILNGAPRCEDLDFSPASLLDEKTAAKQFARQFGTTESLSDVKWRRLGPKEEQLHTGWSQPYLPASTTQNFSFTLPHIEGVTQLPLDDTSYTNTDLDHPSRLDDFVEQSLAFHDALLSSQVVADAGADRTVSSSSFLDNTSFLESMNPTASDHLEDTHDQRPVLHIPSTLTLTTLASLPTASYLRSIFPQTPTVNMMCVVTRSPESKQVVAKKGNYKMTLQEVIVADETMSDFKITFWNRPYSKDPSQTALVSTLAQLKVGHVLLLRNIALTSFRESVYGQSLHPSIVHARTTVDILANDNGVSSRQISALPAPIISTLTRLSRWAKIHIAPDVAQLPRKRRYQDGSNSNNASSSARKYNKQDDMLPPDTMESV